ncbi:MAG: hypothetical protein CM15mV64_560 [uncultured marine virus]|nr:MAG: hypothetical protein CM15mV64_560 [uncultured marine virus]
MATPSSGAISLYQIHVEAGGVSGTACTMNDPDIRLIAGVGSGATASFSTYYNRAADASFTMTVGHRSVTTSGQYSSTTNVWRGYWGGTFVSGVSSPSGGAFGGLSPTSNSDYLGNNTIQIIQTNGTVGGTTSTFTIAVNAVVANNDNAFKSVVVNGTTYNRSGLTYLQSVNDTSWRLPNYSQAAVNNSALAYPPFGAQNASNSIVFRRRV